MFGGHIDSVITKLAKEIFLPRSIQTARLWELFVCFSPIPILCHKSHCILKLRVKKFENILLLSSARILSVLNCKLLSH